MKKIYKIDQEDKLGFLIKRKEGIGGSDIAAVCGLNPYKSVLSVWYEKTQKDLKIEEENIPAEIGLILEDYLEKKFISKFQKLYDEEIELKKMPYILAHDQYDWCRCTLDRYIEKNNEIIPVEFKTTSEYQKDKWKEEEIPEQYYLQVQWQLFITGAKKGYLGVLIGNRVFDIREIPRNENVINMALERADDFWNNFVLKSIMPAPDGSQASEEVLKKLYAVETEGKILEPTDDEKAALEAAAGEVKIWNENKKEAERKLTKAKQTIMSIMKDAEIAFIGADKITYKTVNREGYYVKPASFRTLNIKSIL